MTVQNWGSRGQQEQADRARRAARCWCRQEVTFKDSGQLQTETLVFNCGPAGPKTLDIGIDPVAGEENPRTTRSARVVNVEARKPRILYIQGEPVWEYKFIRRAIDDYPDIGIELVSMLRTTQNKIYRQGIKNAKELEDGFPVKPEELFAYQGLIIGGVEASYFTPSAAAGDPRFRGPSRRRRAVHRRDARRLTDGGWQNSPMADLMPVQLPDSRKGPSIAIFRRWR